MIHRSNISPFVSNDISSLHALNFHPNPPTASKRSMLGQGSSPSTAFVYCNVVHVAGRILPVVGLKTWWFFYFKIIIILAQYRYLGNATINNKLIISNKRNWKKKKKEDNKEVRSIIIHQKLQHKKINIQYINGYLVYYTSSIHVIL